MPEVDFSQVDDVGDFSPLPDGKYLCRLDDVEETTTHAISSWAGSPVSAATRSVTSSGHSSRS